jgi:hypothetical protein
VDFPDLTGDTLILGGTAYIVKRYRLDMLPAGNAIGGPSLTSSSFANAIGYGETRATDALFEGGR